jgi:hypothetical protein
MFARHSRRFATQTELPGVLKGLKFDAHARQDRLEIIESQTVKFAVSYTPTGTGLSILGFERVKKQ